MCITRTRQPVDISKIFLRTRLIIFPILALVILSSMALGKLKVTPSVSGYIEVKTNPVPLDQLINSPGNLGDLRSLPAARLDERAAKFIVFKHHLNDASKISAGDFPKHANNPVKLSARTQRLIYLALSPVAFKSGAVNAKSALMGQCSQDQAWTALESLETDRNFNTASLLAQAMMEREIDPKAKDTLALIAARNKWIADGRVNPDQRYQDLISQASNSEDADVAGQARLWYEATVQPRSTEALMLGQQIWRTVCEDLHQREKGGTLSFTICNAGKAIYDKEMSGNLPQAEKEKKLGRALAIISEAAYDVWRPDILDWAVSAAAPLTQADREDKFIPLYFHAHYIFTKNDFATAQKEFERVFFTGIVCDTAADAGYQMAICFLQQEDLIGSIATLQMLNKLYSTQKEVMPRANYLLGRLRKRVEDLDPALVGQFIEKHYKVQLEKALAEKVKTQPAQQLAQANTAEY